MINLPLKAKYRIPGRTFHETRKGCVSGQQEIYTSVYGGGNQPAKKRTGNSHGPTPKTTRGKHGSLTPPRRVYGPF